jgi:hypothetical protein
MTRKSVYIFSQMSEGGEQSETIVSLASALIKHSTSFCYTKSMKPNSKNPSGPAVRFAPRIFLRITVKTILGRPHRTSPAVVGFEAL